MIYRRFGRTNLAMPVVSCGGMRYQHKWDDLPLSKVPADSQANVEASIGRALELGINHFETARGYGSSERQLGEALARLPREKLIVQTKILVQDSGKEFTREFDDSLRRLRLDYVDLLALHGLNNRQHLEWSVCPGGCLEAARRIQQRGLARHIGFSTHAPTDVIVEAMRADFDYVNLHWYYIFQRNWPAVEEAARRDMGVFVISPSDKGGMLYQPPERLVTLCQPLHPMAFNDLFCLMHPQVHTLSIGAKRPSDFDLHVEAVKQLNQAATVVEPIVQRLEHALAQAVGPELRNPFELRLPEWDATPGQVNIPVILWLRNLVQAYDMKAFGQERYNLLGNGDHWFPGKSAADVAGLNLAEIAAQSGLGDRLMAMLQETHTLLHKASVKRLSQGAKTRSAFGQLKSLAKRVFGRLRGGSGGGRR